MKFAIITHVVHKLNDKNIYAYEPYVREMNLWLKYIDEVEIIAPVSNEDITSIESKYRHREQREAISLNEQIATSHTLGNDRNVRHSELGSESFEKEQNIQMLNRVPHDETSHPEPVEGCLEENSKKENSNQVELDEKEFNSNHNEFKVKSLRQAQTDSSKLYKYQSGSISSNEQIATSHTPHNDRNVRHSELDSESFEKEQKKQMLNRVPNDETRHPEPVEGCHDLKKDKQIGTSHAPVNDGLIKLIQIPAFDITSIKNLIQAIFKIPIILFRIYKTMKWADHIHLRCPGNIGLLGCFVQIVFPNKPKTVKYAGNWDPKSKQPLSFRFQKWIVSNTFLTKNAKVLVYGEWPNQSKNIVPFFTASYSEKEIFERHSKRSEAIFSKEQIATSPTPRNDETQRHPQLDWGSHVLDNNKQIANQVGNDGILKFIYVGGLTPGKQPLLTVQSIHELKRKGYKVQLDIYGDGVEKQHLKDYILDNSLENEVKLHGNTSKGIVKKAYQQAHFLLFISKSEGWPKVVAEAMFWGCLPISSNVSCIPYMLDNGSRGAMVNTEIKEIISVIEDYLEHNEKYEEQVKEAMEWSRQYTLEKFEQEIEKLL